MPPFIISGFFIAIPPYPPLFIFLFLRFVGGRGTSLVIVLPPVRSESSILNSFILGTSSLVGIALISLSDIVVCVLKNFIASESSLSVYPIPSGMFYSPYVNIINMTSINVFNHVFIDLLF